VPSRLIRDPQEPDQAEQTREFDRWRIAAERLREAGLDCYLNIDDNRH